MKIRMMLYTETVFSAGKPVADAPRFDLRVEDARTGDGQEAAFRALCPKGTTSIGMRGGYTAESDYLTLDEARAEVTRLRDLGHEVSMAPSARRALA